MGPGRPRATEEFLTSLSGSELTTMNRLARTRHATTITGGQHDPEQAALAFLALQLDVASVGLNRPARGRETKPRSPRTSRPPLIHAIEAFEDPLSMHGGNAWPGVSDLDHAVGRPRPSHQDVNRALLRGVLDGVVEDIDQGLPQDPGIARDSHLFPDIDDQFLLLLFSKD